MPLAVAGFEGSAGGYVRLYGKLQLPDGELR